MEAPATIFGKVTHLTIMLLAVLTTFWLCSNWTLRYFELHRDGTLMHYRSERDSKPRNTVTAFQIISDPN